MKTETMSIPAIGACCICKKETMGLMRTYFQYDLKCECHSPNHFEIFDHCADCKPNEPLTIKVHLSTKNL